MPRSVESKLRKSARIFELVFHFQFQFFFSFLALRLVVGNELGWVESFRCIFTHATLSICLGRHIDVRFLY